MPLVWRVLFLRSKKKKCQVLTWFSKANEKKLKFGIFIYMYVWIQSSIQSLTLSQELYKWVISLLQKKRTISDLAELMNINCTAVQDVGMGITMDKGVQIHL